MLHRFALVLIALGFSSHFALAQPAEVPTVALLSFGATAQHLSATEESILRTLQGYGFINAEEFGAAAARRDVVGEKLRVIVSDANWELDRLNLMVESAIDQDADVLVAFTTPVAQAALNTTLDMDNPPIVLFVSVYFPFEAGLARSPCIKPDHVTGSQIIPPYDELLSLLKMQSPGATVVGTLNSSDEITGVLGAQVLAKQAKDMGLELVQSAVRQPVNFRIAIDGLVSKGVEALIMPIDSTTSHGLPIIAASAKDHGIPVYFPSLGAISTGAMISAGYTGQFEQGINIGRMLTAFLRGDLDIASTAIDAIGGAASGVNLDTASALEIEIKPEIVESADFVIEGGVARFSTRLEAASAEISQLRAVDRSQAGDQAYLDSLQCTPEMIAEEQAELDAAEE